MNTTDISTLTAEELAQKILCLKQTLLDCEAEINRRKDEAKKEKWAVVVKAMKDYLADYGIIHVETYCETLIIDHNVVLDEAGTINMENY